MPKVNISDRYELERAQQHREALKCKVGDGYVEVADLARVDLFTPTGIQRQIRILEGQPYLRPNLDNFHISTTSDNVITISSPHISLVLTDEFIRTIHHYFNGRIKIEVNGCTATITSASTKIDQDFLRVIISNAVDLGMAEGMGLETRSDVLECLGHDTEVEVTASNLLDLFGTTVTLELAVIALEKMGYTVKVQSESILAKPPFFRTDVSSTNDALEDILIMHIANFAADSRYAVSSKRRINTEERASIYRQEAMAARLTQHGFKEVSTKLLGDTTDRLREELIDELMHYERSRQHVKYPHNIFEVGEVFNGVRLQRSLALYSSGNKVDINHLYSILHEIFASQYGLQISLVSCSRSYFQEGKTFEIHANNRCIGIIGYVDTGKASKYRQRHECVYAEVDLNLQ